MSDEKKTEGPVSVFVCGSSSFHPYECDGPKGCIHCRGEKTDSHDPDRCALCQDGQS